ncbi:MAG: dihydropteroate synthase [Bacteroidales bacterium]|jgi:dihydropteroate synthase|nr:dihydropteroate synthase [Bacteroidales bacterium]
MFSLCLKQQLLSLDTPIIMGILNITEDSFFDGGKYLSETAALKRVEQILEEGATIVDLGAVSTKPNAIGISENQEFETVYKYLKLIVSHFPEVHISVDTFRSKVADMAIKEGAAMINDVTGGADESMFHVIGKNNIPYVLTHNNHNNPLQTKELIPNILSFFGDNIEKLISSGVKDIIIDPGFGFGKTLEQNYYLLRQLKTFSMINYPVLVGISRKSMIQKVLGVTSSETLCGTVALNLFSLFQGANILRVHDVKQCAECIKLFNLIYSQ